MLNSIDPDQLASQKLTDPDLHCLQRRGISGFSRTRVNLTFSVTCSVLMTGVMHKTWFGNLYPFNIADSIIAHIYYSLKTS